MNKLQDFLKPKNIALVIMVAGIYFLAAKLGLSLAFLNASVSPVWPPTGVAIALVLWFGYRAAPGVFLGAFVANYFLTDVPVATTFGIAIGNGLEAVTALYLIQLFVESRNPFNRAYDVLKFIVFAAIVSTMVSATIGNLSLIMGGAATWANFARLWLTWWLGDGVGALVVTPLIICWIDKPIERWRGWKLIEAVLLLVALALLSATIYTTLVFQSAPVRPWGHITIPLLLWAAFRFGPRGVSTAIAAVSVIAIWGTTKGYGPFAVFSTNEALLYFQAYIADLAITTLALAAIVTERKLSQQHLTGTLSVARILADSPALSDALPRMLQRICMTFDWELGAMWTLDPAINQLRCLKVWPARGASVSRFEAKCYEITFPIGIGLPGRVWKNLNAAWIPDVTQDDNFPRASDAAAEGLHAAFGFPILSGEEFLGAMEFFSHEIREPDASLLATFTGVGSQIGQFIERKQAEEAIVFAARLPSENPSPVIRVSEGKILSFANPAAKQVLAQWEISLGEPVPANIAETANSALLEDRRRTDELRIGDRIYAIDFAPIRDANYVNLYFNDITERKQAEESLRESQLRHTRLIESAMDAIIAVDQQQRVIIFNPAAEKMFGCPVSEALGSSLDRFIPARFREAHREHIESFGHTGVTNRRMGALTALSGLRANGEEFPIEASISQTSVGGERLFKVILRDITERKRAEEERERLLAREYKARTEAERASRIKDDFLATLSHELRTPLTAMLGWLSILRTQHLDEETTSKAIETIERNAQAQAKLVEDLIDVSRIVGGKLNLEVQPIDPLPVIEAAMEVVRPAATAKGVRTEIKREGRVGPVAADPARLQQIIWNLLSNAVKFTSRDGLVQISLREAASSAEVVVHDTGIGIEPEFLPHVFERFSQAESPVTRLHRGLGLGLAIVRHLTELHGGTVKAESEGEGRGTTFTITIPLAGVSAVDSDKLKAVRTRKGKKSTQPLDGLRVLVIEDEPDARELLSMTLEVSGAKVETVESAQAALESLSLFRPDVLLSDIGLPTESGYDLIRKVRALPSESSKIPAVALTAFASEKDREHALSAGFQMHLAKPVDPNELIRAIRSLAYRDGRPRA